MLDLDRDVEGDIGVGGMQRPDDAPRVARPVEEIRIAERDVARPGENLRIDVGQDDLGLHDAELAVVDRDDWTVPAEMTAAAARFGVSDDGARAVGALQRRVPIQWRETAAIGDEELEAR